MKNIEIYIRNALVKTRFRQFKFKQVKEYFVKYENKEWTNSEVSPYSPLIKNKYDLLYKGRSINQLKITMKLLGRTDGEKELRLILEDIIKSIEESKNEER